MSNLIQGLMAIFTSKKESTPSLEKNKVYLIYLDFDGVLHPFNSNRFNKAEYLAKILAELEQELDGISIKVIISSGWRVNKSIAELNSWLPDSLVNRVVGTTPYIRTDSRESEILTSVSELKTKYNLQGFFALDDDISLFPNTPDWLIHTDIKFGFDEKCAKVLARKMGYHE